MKNFLLNQNRQEKNLSTIKNITYIRALKKFFKTKKTMNYQSVVSYLNDCKKKYSNNTILIYRSALKKYIKNNISDLNQKVALDIAFNDIKVGKANKFIPHSKTISKEIVSKMMAVSNNRDAIIIESLFITGVRVSELINIKLNDCAIVSDSSEKYVTLAIKGKGNKERLVNLNLVLFKKIRKVFNGENYLFETTNRTKYQRNHFYKVVNRAGKRVLGTKQVHPHTLRHSFATHFLIHEKKSLKAVSNYLGHSTTAITSDFYIHDDLTIKDIDCVSL